MVSHTSKHGRLKQRSETYVETVTDFDFTIDVGRNLPSGFGPVHWSVPDSEPAYRGKMVREVEIASRDAQIPGNSRRKATRSENKASKAWETERRERGLPPWVGSAARWQGHGGASVVDESASGLMSSKTLRNWADEYCASRKHLKEFTYEKVCPLHHPHAACSDDSQPGCARMGYRCPQISYSCHHSLDIVHR